jgi:2-amino-4-hydroxy-6-hydroxymethyldihydropteridine diphosphokinase
MASTLFSLGANLGNVRETMLAAKRLFQESFRDDQLAFSQLFRTPPVGGPGGQGDFLNAVVRLHSNLDPWQAWEFARYVESVLGRQRQTRWEARRIDVDVLLHDNERIWTPHFKLPHPRMCMRSFVLIPALEIAADCIDPVSQLTLSELCNNLRASKPIGVIAHSSQLPAIRSLLERGSSNRSIVFRIEDRVPSESSLEPSKLWMVAVSNPDPDTIQWEDYSRNWVEWLRLKPSQHSQYSTAVPRYLFPSHDLKWAVHEIESAETAMTCSIEPAGDFQ